MPCSQVRVPERWSGAFRRRPPRNCRHLAEASHAIRRLNQARSTPRSVAAVLIVFAVVALLSLFPTADSSPTSGAVLFYGERATADAVLNILFYAPLGVALGLLPIRYSFGVAAGCLVSILMEATQLTVPGRFSSLSDVVANTSGTALGLLAVRTFHRYIVPHPRLAGQLSLGGGILFAVMCVVTGYLMEPDFPRGTYTGQWTPDLGQYDQPYVGEVHHVEIGRHVLPSTVIENPDEVRTLLLTEEPLRIQMTAGPQPPSLSPIFRLVRRLRMPILVVGVDGDDLVLMIRRRASKWLLGQPSSYAHGLMEGVEAGAEVQIQLWRDEDRTCLSVANRTDCTLTPTLGSGWSLLLGQAPLDPSTRLPWNAAWLAVIAFPTGFWLRANPTSVVGLALLLGAGAASPMFWSVARTPAIEWLSIALGLGTGLALQRFLRRKFDLTVGPSDSREPAAPPSHKMRSRLRG